MQRVELAVMEVDTVGGGAGLPGIDDLQVAIIVAQQDHIAVGGAVHGREVGILPRGQQLELRPGRVHAADNAVVAGRVQLAPSPPASHFQPLSGDAAFTMLAPHLGPRRLISLGVGVTVVGVKSWDSMLDFHHFLLFCIQKRQGAGAGSVQQQQAHTSGLKRSWSVA